MVSGEQSGSGIGRIIHKSTAAGAGILALSMALTGCGGLGRVASHEAESPAARAAAKKVFTAGEDAAEESKGRAPRTNPGAIKTKPKVEETETEREVKLELNGSTYVIVVDYPFGALNSDGTVAESNITGVSCMAVEATYATGDGTDIKTATSTIDKYENGQWAPEKIVIDTIGVGDSPCEYVAQKIQPNL